MISFVFLSKRKTMKFCQQWNFPFIYFATLNFDSFSTNACLRFHRRYFFVRKGAFQWNKSTKNTPQRTKILIYPAWNKILKIWDTLFEIIQIEVQCSKKNTPKIGKIYILSINRKYLLCLQSNPSGSFLQACINFAE